MFDAPVSPNSLEDLIERVAKIVDGGTPISNKELLKLCSEYRDFGKVIDSHFCHEIAETAINLLIRRKHGQGLLTTDEPVHALSRILRPLQKQLPTQTWRSENQITFQQFSTPLAISYLAAYLLNIKDRESVLEPSSGTGSLAVWAAAAGAVVTTNDIDSRRNELIRVLGFEPHELDAEFIDDLLPDHLIPDVVLANPPFSSSGGRTRRNSVEYGFHHVDSALRRLRKGGRFAVIFGENGSPASRSGSRFWKYLHPEIKVRASIELPGSEFYCNGTSVRTTLILGTKPVDPHCSSSELTSQSHIGARSVEDAFEQSLTLDIRF